MIKKIQLLILISITLILVTSCKSKEVQTVAIDPVNNEEVDTKTEEPAVIRGCTKDAKQCANGKVVGRNPKNNCEFDPCETQLPKTKTDLVMCSADVKECPDGTFVGRDHSKNCKFKDCPNSEQ